MAKTSKIKKPSKPSIHSRASRRISSPSLEGNVDKSLASLKPPSRSNVLAAHTNAGISKSGLKKKGGKILKRKQKIRLEQGKEKAEAVNGKLARKVERAEKGREGKKARSAAWDDLNEVVAGKKSRKEKKKGKGGAETGGDGWEDEDMDAVEEEEGRDVMKDTGVGLLEVKGGGGELSDGDGAKDEAVEDDIS